MEIGNRWDLSFLLNVETLYLVTSMLSINAKTVVLKLQDWTMMDKDTKVDIANLEIDNCKMTVKTSLSMDSFSR